MTLTPRRFLPLALVALLAGGCVANPAKEANLQQPELKRQASKALSEVESTAETIAELGAVDRAGDPDDLWTRVRGGFALPASDHLRTRQEREWYARHPKFLDRTFERSEPYLHYIVEEVERRGMPQELALLPVVESAFQPFAYSHGRAAGLWQFIPGTGRRFGLTQNWWYDGRRDVVASTHAALDYLEYLNREFDGDWLLALAAYNSGEGNVQKAVRKNLAQELPIDFWSLDLPRETEGYVPKLLAIRDLVADPAAHDVELAPIPNQPVFTQVDVGSQIDLALAADMADLSLDELYRFNPGYNRWATDPDGPHRLVLPLEKAEGFAAALAEHPPENRVQWQRHRIRNGETLSAIAESYRTTPEVIKEVNHLRGNVIRAGQHLIIPVAARSPQSYALSQEQRLKRLQGRDREGTKVSYTVKSGDTWWDIARKFGVNSTRTLARWNGKAPGDLLRPGERLVVWVQDTTAAAPAIARANTPAAARRTVSYTVRRGDSLARIARRFRVSIGQIKEWNAESLGGNRYLQPGQRLTLYVDVTRQSGG